MEDERDIDGYLRAHQYGKSHVETGWPGDLGVLTLCQGVDTS